MKIYRHALAAVLLLIWQWLSALDIRLHGTITDRLLAGLHGEPRPWRPLEAPLICTSIRMFTAVQRLFPECYSDEAIFGTEEGYGT